MQTEDTFYRYVWRVADQWADELEDWPQIEIAVKNMLPTDMERHKVLSLLIGLRAAERLDYPQRGKHRDEILAELRFARGTRLRSEIRRRARALAFKRVQRIQSKLIFGFFLDRGRRSVSKADLNNLLEPIEYIWYAGSGDRQVKLTRVYGQFRSRVNRLKQDGGPGIEQEARNLFDTVYNMVIEYIWSAIPRKLHQVYATKWCLNQVYATECREFSSVH